mgnify:CR=1 FL=1
MRNRSRLVLSLVLLMCGVIPALRAAELTVPLMKTGPAVDGKVGQDEWKVSAGFAGFQWKGDLQRRPARGYVGATSDHIYVAIVSRLPDEGQLKTDVTRDSLKVAHDDSVEVYVNPTPDAADRVDYQFLVNSAGKCAYNIHKTGRPDEKVSWRGGWEQAHGFHDGWWHFECMIPVDSMNLVAPGRTTTEGLWSINLTRNWKNPWEWSSLAGGYAQSGIRVRFVEEAAPTVHFSLKDDCFLPPFEGELRMHNPSNSRLNLNATLSLGRAEMPALRSDTQLLLEPGETRSVSLDVPEDDPTTRYGLTMKVNSGRGVHYKRKLSWKRAEEPYRWAVGTREKPPLDFRFAYYPSRDRMRILADGRGLPAEARLKRVIAIVRTAVEKNEIKAVQFPASDFTDGLCEREFELPPLDGRYQIALKAEGAEVPSGERVKPFDRTVYPWEETPTGGSTEVYPPFTPIEVDTGRQILETVLRKHTLNRQGLIEQVEATSAHTGVTKPILPAPMRYAVSSDGQAYSVKARALEFAQTDDHRVVTEGGFQAGELKATFRDTWDYDGCVKVELTLHPTAGKAIEGLRLEIPFADDSARLVHANSDRIRAPVATEVPDGKGVVWDSREVAGSEFPPTFCPYIFVGTPVRGLCWFAENDLNWGWDSSRPNLDLYRTGDQVLLRVHLINEPTVIQEPRTITFGLQAAPVKPRLVAPGEGKHWWRYRYNRDDYTLLGTDINWLARGHAGSVYPAGKDLYLWEIIARGNREKLSGETIREVERHGRRYFKPYGEAEVQRWKAHVHHNLRSRYGNKMVFYYNRASYQKCPEFQTFQDEWNLTDYRSVGPGEGLGEIKIVPTESYINFALYWYARSFEIGRNRGVYWDNFFIASSYNTEMTDAYRLPDGSIRPAAGIWQLRELAKRTFIMMNERDMLPVTFAHMTSFAPLPILSFCTLQYDWEWKYGQGDTQDRFSRELTLLTTTGELAGTWPVMLGGRGDTTWKRRTYAAVRLLHELDGGGGWMPRYREEAKPLWALAEPVMDILDEEGLKVYRYWDERPQPVVAAEHDVPTIVYSVPSGEAVVAAISYEEKDADVTLEVDAKRLGFEEGYRVVNVETGREMQVENDRVSFPLKAHDVRVLRFLPEGNE